MKKIIKKIFPWYNYNEKIIKYYLIMRKYVYRKCYFLAYYYSYKIMKQYSCHFSLNCKINKTVYFPHPTGIVIGDGVIIGANSIIYQNVTLGRKNKDVSKYPVIGKGVIIYANSIVLGNVHIGDNAVIGCNSVVLRDVKDGEVVSGIVK